MSLQFITCCDNEFAKWVINEFIDFINEVEMIIRCDSCNARFRLDDSKVKGRGVKVRCTKCQNIFVVTPPEPEKEIKETFETPFAAPGEAKEEEKIAPSGEGEKEEEAGEGLLGREPVSTEIEHGFDFGADLPSMEGEAEKGEEGVGKRDEGKAEGEFGKGSEEISFEKKTEEKTEKSPIEEEESYGFAPDLEKGGLEEGVVEKTEGVSGAEFGSLAEEMPRHAPEEPTAQTPSTEDFMAEEEKVEGEERPRSEAAVGKAAKGNKIKILILLIIIIVGVVFYLTTRTEKGVLPQKTMDITKLRGYPLENSVIGSLFVIEGKLVSFSDKTEKINGIKGALFDKTGKQIAARVVSPGRVVSAQELKSITKVDLEKRFKGGTGAAIPAKGSVPFMVVFYKEPSGLGEFTVEVLK